MFSTNKVEIENAVATRKPVYCRQIGGITWMALQHPVVHFSIFEYWLGDDYPRQPESVTRGMDELLRARLAVRNFLTTYGRELENPWYEYLAHEVGLDLTEKRHHSSSRPATPGTARRIQSQRY